MRGIGTSVRLILLGVIASTVACVAVLANQASGRTYQLSPVNGSLLGDPFVVPGMSWLSNGQQQAAERARLSSPEAVAARESSRTAYARLGRGGVARLLSHTFPAVVEQAGAARTLPAGTHIVRYLTANAVQVLLPGHRPGIMEYNSPVAKRGADGHYAPVDLSLSPAGGDFLPARSPVTVHIPSQLSDGVRMPGDGVSLIPVDGQGRPLSASGSVEGVSVVYANTQPASDTVVKPTATGFQLDGLLRSSASPEQLFFKVSGPAGTSLTQDARSGAVLVKAAGSTLATVLPPGASDAVGTTVPASMSVSGDTLVVDVPHRSASFQYPIEVDPEVNDSQLAITSTGKPSNWVFKSTNEARFGHKALYEGPGKERLETTGTAEYAATEFAYWGYETKGNSKIYELKTKTSAKNTGAKLESFLQFTSAAGNENKILLSTEVEGTTEYSEKLLNICGWNASKVEECLPGSGKEKNGVRFQQSATASPGANFKFSDTLSEGVVSISEPAGEHSTTSFNTTSPEVEGEVEVEGKKVVQKRVNALYGAGIWLTKSKGALQFIAKDPGIGVATTRLEYEKSAGVWEKLSEHKYLESENACHGVQCYAEHPEYWTLDPKLPDGQDKIRYRAEEALAGTVSLESEVESTKTVKVDTTAPRNLALDGLPFGDELSERPYKLSAEAIDGTGATVASSGVKSITLFLSGHEVAETGKQTGCSVSKGECKATAEWTLNGAELGAGHHAIVLVAIDNAGNEARIERTISVRHSTPVALGPGSVDLQSGDYSMGSTDVSMGSGLTLARNVSSRSPEAGIEGPLGPQWSLNVGVTESLVEMVDGSVLLTDANGAQAIFASIGAGEFESPSGDSNIKLRLEENKETKQKLAYYLEDSAKHTKVKFTLPSGGTRLWVPAIQEGTNATDTVSFTYRTAEQAVEYSVPSGTEPQSVIAGPDGNVWFTANQSSKIGKMTLAGTVLAEYSLPAGSKPCAITVGPDGNLWFANLGTSKIGKITTSGAITEYALASGSEPEGITVGPEKNLWFTEWGTSKIGKITTSGVVTQYALSESGKGPTAIAAGPDGNLWFTVTESLTPKIGKITTAGAVTEYAIPKSSYGITAGPDGKMWFTELAVGGAIGQITTAGVIKEFSLPSSSSPQHITAGPDKNLWFTDVTGHKIDKITTAGVVTEYAVSFGPVSIGIGPDENIWFTKGGTGENKVSEMTTSGTMTEPVEVLAPVPAGVSCSPMKAGCRALKFTYASATTATGENMSEWGEYRNRLTKVLLNAYDPVGKAMKETAVAEYSYDKLGRLRAEWDPRISPALKTTYGYDAEGHVTALGVPGKEPWTFTYGPIAGDAGTGRLLKANLAPASEALWGGSLPVKTEAPVLSGSAVIGVRMTVSNGKWSNSPVAYGYQWEDCNTSGEACTPITGANNQNYTPVASDVGHKLVAVVTATNGGGSVSASSAPSAVVSARFQRSSVDASSLNAAACVPGTTDCVLSDSKGSALYATNVSASSAASWTSWTGPAGVSPSEALSCPTTTLCLMADGNKSGAGDLYYATSLGGAWTLAYSPSYGVDAISCVSSSFCVDAQDNFGYFRYSINPPSTAWTLEDQGSASMKAVFCLSSSFCAIADGVGNIHVATTTTQIESSTWTSTNVDGTTALNGVSCVSTTSCVAVDGAGNVLNLAIAAGGGATATKHNIDGANSLTAVACPTSSECVTVDNKGNVFVSSNAGATWTEPYQPGGSLTSVACASSTLCVTVDTTGNETAFDPTGGGSVTEGEAKTPSAGYTMEYGVPLSGSGLPSMTAAEVAKWGQVDEPVEATAIMPPDAAQGWPASNYKRATIHYLDEQGREVNVSSPSTASHGSVSTTEHNEANDVTRTLSPDNRQAALEAGSKSVEVAKSLATYYAYREECSKESENKHEAEGVEGARLCDVEGPQHTIKYMAGKEQREALGRLHTKYFYDEESPAGETYNLQTKSSTLAELANEEEVEVRKSVTSYSGQSNLGWKLRAPTSVTIDPEGKKLTTTTSYNSATGQVLETRTPAGGAGASPHDTKYVYYTAEANTEGYAACGGHPEWATLLCETLPAKQPETAGVPSLPAITISSYNVYNEPLVVTETFGSTVRTKTKTYDAAGRLTTSETTSTANTALPKLTDEYNTTTGVLEKLSTTVGEKTQAITSKYNKLGQLTEYADADGNIAKYRYGGLENDGLLEEISDGSSSGTGKQTFSYNATTKQLEELTDSAAGVFKASYDAEGRIVSETYPNAMCADTAYNSTGEATGIEYLKTNICSEHSAPVWFSETRVPSVRGETFSRSSTLASEIYSYDSVGRLTETHETPTGEGCTTRLYAYDEESNRLSQTTRTPGTEGKCASEGGTTLGHTYDTGNRLTDAGVAYDSFGDLTKVPAADAEGHELSSTFYVDGAVASQTQNGATNNYYLDPEGRIRETVSGATPAISHYDGAGETVAWTSEGPEKTTRNIPGIDGALAAVQTNGGTPVLQLHDLQGNVAATAALSPSETKLLSTYNSTEFGVPNKEKAPPKYAWLGAGDVASAFSSGVITYGATSYVPQIGRALQSEPIEAPGIAPGGTGAGAAYMHQEEPWMFQGAAAAASEAPGLEAAREQAAMEAAMAAAAAEAAAEGAAEEAPAGVDPSLWISLTAGEANTLASALEKSVGALASLAKSSSIKGFTMRWVNLIKQVWGERGFGWNWGMAAGLKKCAKAINSSSGTPARCKFKLDYLDYRDDSATGDGTPGAGEVTAGYGGYLCWGQEHKGGGKTWWTYPYCSLEVGIVHD